MRSIPTTSQTSSHALQVMSSLAAPGLAGGAYVGVGPDQNFSYIAQLKPSIAFIVDIRRDNMLLHLLFKALFELSQTRVEYLSLLCGRPVPATLDGWRTADIDRITAYVDAAARTSAADVAALRTRVDGAIRRFGVALSDDDFVTIDRFHRTFIDGGLDLKFKTFAFGVRSYFPNYRDLLLETDHAGQRSNYLASEDRFQFVRSLEQRDLVIPVVGNFVGTHALAAIGRLMTDRGVRLSAFYTSNVEFYLFTDRTFPKFIDNLSQLPHTDRSVIVRSVFSGAIASLMPQAVPGYPSASIVQSMNELLEGYSSGAFHEYRELTTVRAPQSGTRVR